MCVQKLKKPKKEELGAIIGITVLVIFILLGIYSGTFSMNSILFNGQWFMYAGIVGLFLWGFRDRIDTWFHKPVTVSTSSRLHTVEYAAEQEKKRENENKKKALTKHSNKLIKKYNRFISDYLKVADSTLEEYLSTFTHWRHFQQHLYTGHRELYDLIAQNDYYLFLERMKQDLLDGISLKSKILGGACSECLNLHDEKDIPQLQHALSQLQ